MTVGDHVRRRVVQKEPAQRIAPGYLLTPSHDPTTHIGTSLEGREPRQQAPRARSDRVFTVPEHVWVSMGTGRVDRWKFGSFAVPSDDALVRETRGLMPLPGGGNVAVQRIHSSNLAISVNRVVDGLLPLPGDLRNTSDGTFPVSQDKNDDKASLRDCLTIRSLTGEENLDARETPDDLRSSLTECDAHGERYKAWRDLTREADFQIYKDWPSDDDKSSLLYVVRHCKKHGVWV